MNIGLKTTTFGGRTNFLDSSEVRFIRGGITLDAAQVAADGGTGLKKLLAGTFVGVSGGKYRKYIAAVKAHLHTGVVANNNAVLWTAVTGGAAGNSIKVALLDPGGNNKPLEVTIINDEIRVNLATGADGAISSTAAQVIAAVNTHLFAKTLVLAANDGASTGAAAVVAAAAAPLAEGANANVVPSLILADDVTFSSVDSVNGVTHADQIVTAIDHARVISARLPVAPDDYVRASMPGITWA